ncbi:MAG: DUF2283 domain-containing protein [Dehalococcoidia bacterium]
MAMTDFREYLALVPAVKSTPDGYLWSSYDAEADVLYINFKKPSIATDSELTEDDIIVRYEGDEVVGLTILHASSR